MTGIGAQPRELIERGMASFVADAMESARAVALHVFAIPPGARRGGYVGEGLLT